ncbi:hypothetical protein P7K49_035335 [Saguinus oedipus]|uniref:Uncharacterized protein n=1 Tax=Saguinus oedipus TaxID=9490 RepID=A0ABQ9TMB9_SAGOE|nr:hypothetical protein P7K49_035335 [Saguinus oedipus]
MQERPDQPCSPGGGREGLGQRGVEGGGSIARSTHWIPGEVCGVPYSLQLQHLQLVHSTQERLRIGQEGTLRLPEADTSDARGGLGVAAAGRAVGRCLSPHLLCSPSGSFSSAVDLEQVWELDSLEYLEALECVTDRLESRVNFCKAHLMMITCFDVTSRRR